MIATQQLRNIQAEAEAADLAVLEQINILEEMRNLVVLAQLSDLSEDDKMALGKKLGFLRNRLTSWKLESERHLHQLKTEGVRRGIELDFGGVAKAYESKLG